LRSPASGSWISKSDGGVDIEVREDIYNEMAEEEARAQGLIVRIRPSDTALRGGVSSQEGAGRRDRLIRGLVR